MKKYFLIAAGITMLLPACKDSTAPVTPVKDTATIQVETTTTAVAKPTANQGTYSSNENAYVGDVYVQTADATEIFTVRCSGDIINEITFYFKNEAAARTGGAYHAGGLMPIDDKEVGINYGVGYQSKEVVGGAITIKREGNKNVLKCSDVPVEANGKTIKITASIPF